MAHLYEAVGVAEPNTTVATASAAQTGSHDTATPDRARSFAMTVDVEDFFQVWAFSDVVSRKSWDGFALRVEDNTRRVLDLFDVSGAKATFFILGWVAEKTPALVREIAARGHEIASHGYDHQKVFDQSEDQFRDDVRRSKLILEDLSGAPVTGYRAPGFSINAQTPFAYEVLSELDFAYSSSTHPIAHDHYGDPQGERSAFRPLASRSLIEAPVATAPIFNRRVSAAGGGWFRAFPYGVSRRLLRRARETSSGPVVFYFHPWEIDPGQPRIAGAKLKARLRHYLNLDSMEGKLARLLDACPWSRLDDALGVTELQAAA